MEVEVQGQPQRLQRVPVLELQAAPAVVPAQKVVVRKAGPSGMQIQD